MENYSKISFNFLKSRGTFSSIEFLQIDFKNWSAQVKVDVSFKNRAWIFTSALLASLSQLQGSLLEEGGLTKAQFENQYTTESQLTWNSGNTKQTINNTARMKICNVLNFGRRSQSFLPLFFQNYLLSKDYVSDLVHTAEEMCYSVVGVETTNRK